MKKLLFLITLCTTIGSVASAQNTSFGLKAGMTAANMKESFEGLNLSYSTKIGFYAGTIAEIGIAENFAVQPELFFALMGAQLKDSGINAKLNLGYINLPVLLKYKSQGFSVFAGPQIGYLVFAKAKNNGKKEDVKDQFKSTDFSAVIGAGYTLTNGFGFDARYQFGISNISKDTEMDGSGKNSAFNVGVHYFFNK